MKRRPVSRSTKRPARVAPRPRGAGKATGKKSPTPGWKGHDTLPRGWRNPRPPALPAGLTLTDAGYYAAATIIGLLAGQTREPNKRWAKNWSFDMGELMAAEARRRHRRRRRAA